MIRLHINGRAVEVLEGTTVLQAARSAGADIPTLCHLEGEPAFTTCFVCVVEVEGRARLLPSCGLPAEEGMRVVTDSPRVLDARREAIELLLSDHVGDCEAPCRGACPAGLPAPDVIGWIARGDTARAARALLSATPLALALETICPRFCERACRRSPKGGAVAIRDLCRFAIENAPEFAPSALPLSGKRVAVIGAGPCGLAAAFDLLRAGHDCEVYDAAAEAGGALRAVAGLSPASFAPAVQGIASLGGRFRFGQRLGTELSLSSLRARHDAVLLSLGAWRGGGAPGQGRRVDLELLAGLGLVVTDKGLEADRWTGATSVEGVFGAGEVVSGASHAARAVGAGRRAAESIDRYLRKGAPLESRRRVNVVMGKLSPEEMETLFAKGATDERVAIPSDGRLCPADAEHEAGRCLRCDCGKKDACSLRELASRLGAKPRRFDGARRRYEVEATHADVVYESGKCVSCGRCSAVAARMGEKYGLSFAGRGFTVRVDTALNRPMSEALTLAARRCVQTCPTGALSFKPGRIPGT